ncbi:MAG: hypothetical protein JWM33_760 [Caulobacteraceae bacterium]|nr:hypothetical protein [Caulobacteraceae bacterium]
MVVNLVTADTNGGLRFGLLLAGGLVACAILAIVAAGLEAGGKKEQDRLEREYAAHRSGYQTLSQEISKYISLARTLKPGDPDLSKAPLDLMFSACRDLYATLEAEYGYKVSVSEHIEFEVTFMTCSVRDGEITVAAWENRDRRAPKSLAGRKTDPNLYSGTETYQLYQDKNRTARFVSSTEGTGYKELYPGQKKRIRSSVIWPVVDDEFGLRGTLVVHCDREKFFSTKDEKLWRETLEPYTKRLALARVLAERVSAGGLDPGF